MNESPNRQWRQARLFYRKLEIVNSLLPVDDEHRRAQGELIAMAFEVLPSHAAFNVGQSLPGQNGFHERWPFLRFTLVVVDIEISKAFECDISSQDDRSVFAIF